MVERFILTTQQEQLPGFDLLIEGKFFTMIEKDLATCNRLQTSELVIILKIGAC